VKGTGSRIIIRILGDLAYRIGFSAIHLICHLLVSGPHNTTGDRMAVAARLSHLAAEVRTEPYTDEVTL
jgi:hypothetical protein